MRPCLLLAGVLTGMVSLVTAASAEPPPEVLAKLSGEVRSRLASLPASERISIDVVLEEATLPRRADRAARRAAIRARQQQLLDRLPQSGWQLGRRYENLPGFSGRANARQIEALAKRPGVKRIDIDGDFHANLSQGVPLTGADVAHAVGYTGATVGVAVLDTGIDTDHPDLAGDILAERCYCAGSPSPNNGCCPGGGDTQSGPGSAEDDEGHGTSVSGIITSDRVSSLGVAPDAGIVAIKVLSGTGSGKFSDTAAALDWLITNHASYDVRVVNLSLGDGGEYANPLSSTCNLTSTALAIRDLHALGVATFVASGNDGHDDGISYPACTPEAISVGGVYDANVGSVSWCGTTCATTLCSDPTTFADKFVCHSNSDEILDLLTPDWRTRTSQLGGSTRDFGGTSAAAPYASALAALLFEADPSRSPDDVLGLMTSNGPMVTNPDNGLSFRRTDVSTLFGVCGNTVVEAGEACDDGNTVGGDCCSATCQFEPFGSACDDEDACTDLDSCDATGSCNQSTPLVCDDGSFCNGAESCDAGSGCLAGTPPTTDDGVGCTLDSCDEVNDVVVNAPDHAACDNGAFCDGGELCDSVLDCVSGAPPTVDDGIACTIDACDELGDVVIHTPDDPFCDDALFCDGVEYCSTSFDCQPGTPPMLDDGVVCTIDACDEAADVVTHTPDVAACDDGDVCTAELCDAQTGCASEPIPGCIAQVPATGSIARLFAALTFAGLGAFRLLLAARRSRDSG